MNNFRNIAGGEFACALEHPSESGPTPNRQSTGPVRSAHAGQSRKRHRYDLVQKGSVFSTNWAFGVIAAVVVLAVSLLLVHYR